MIAGCECMLDAMSKFAGPYILFDTSGSMDPQRYSNIAAEADDQAHHELLSVLSQLACLQQRA